jgi:hypothetical protein
MLANRLPRFILLIRRSAMFSTRLPGWLTTLAPPNELPVSQRSTQQFLFPRKAPTDRLSPLTTLPLEMGRHCTAHIKAMAGMDLTEHRRPLDGRWLYRRGSGWPIHLRVCTIPILHGEDFPLRLLDRAFGLLDLDGLSLLPPDSRQLREFLASPSGLILVSGPTGAGKMTTLHACLQHLTDGHRKINTIEDLDRRMIRLHRQILQRKNVEMSEKAADQAQLQPAQQPPLPVRVQPISSPLLPTTHRAVTGRLFCRLLEETSGSRLQCETARAASAAS